MPNSTPQDVKTLTAEDMRNYMYGEIQSMIEGNAPKNVAFHYFMPPIPFGPELASFMDIGPKAKEWKKDLGFTNNDLMRAAINFATIVDYVPEISKDTQGQVVDINTLIQGESRVSTVYDSILKYCRVVNNSRSEADQEKLEKLRALLYKIPEVKKVEAGSDSSSAGLSDEELLSGLGDGDVNLDDLFSEGTSASTQSFIADPDSISEPTTATILYDALALNYDTVVLAVLDQLKNISPNDPNAGLRKKVLLGKIQSAKQRWEAQGKKTAVESIKARIRQMSQGGMPDYLSELRDRFEGSEMLASIFSDEEFGQSLLSEYAHYTALRPNGILSANGIMRVTMSSSHMDKMRKFQSSSTKPGFGFVIGQAFLGVTGSKVVSDEMDSFYNTDFEISFEIVQGLIDRPWFEKAFIESRAYTTLDPQTGQALDVMREITKLSDGKTPPEDGALKAIPMTVYFIKDLKVRSTVLKSLEEKDKKAVTVKGGGSIFGFGARAEYKNDTINTTYTKDESEGVISADGIYLIGMSSVYLKNSPNPDFESFPADKWI